MSYALNIRDFPQELLVRLKLDAVARGVTLKALVVERLSGSGEGKTMRQKPKERESGGSGAKVEPTNRVGLESKKSEKPRNGVNPRLYDQDGRCRVHGATAPCAPCERTQ